MALLFDEAQGAFKDTGSQTSPMKKSTGMMRKQMTKMDEVAPRGHTLAYITPEEAEILNRGGGGIDAQGNQMQGPYGIPMYPGYTETWNPGISRKSNKANVSSLGRGSPHKDVAAPTKTKPTVTKPPGPHRDAGDKKTGDVKEVKKEVTSKKVDEPIKNISDNKYFKDLNKDELNFALGVTDTIEDKQIKQNNFDTNRFMQTIGTTVNVDGKTINEQLLINPHLTEQLELKEKGDSSILDRKNQVSNEIIEHLKNNTPENIKEKTELIFLLDRLPKNVKDNVKKAIDNGEVSLDIVPVKSTTENFDKLSTGDFVFNPHIDEEPKTVTDALVQPNYIELMEEQRKDLKDYDRTPTGLVPPSILNPPIEVENPKAKIVPTGLAPPSILNPPIADKIKIDENNIVTGLTETPITVDDAKKIADEGWSIQNIQNVVPSNIRALLSDVWITQTGIGEHKVFTEKNLSSKYQEVLKNIVKNNLNNGKNIIEYPDYETTAEGESPYRDVDASVTDLGIIKKMFKPGYNLKTTLGQVSIIIDENNNVIIKDRYNFNDAVDIQSIPDILNAAKDIGFPYGIPRKIGQLWGSNDQEGAFIEINLGNYDELMKD